MRDGRSFTDFDPRSLCALSAEDAVALFAALLRCCARKHGVPLTSITISMRVDVPDGGIDAEVGMDAPADVQDPVVRGNSFYQIKAGVSATPWRGGWIRRELFGAVRKASKGALGSAVRECMERNGHYILVCFGADLTGNQRRQAIAHLRACLMACGYRRARVDVWGQSQVSGLIEQYPSLVLRLSDRHGLPFRTHGDWRLLAGMCASLHVGQAQQAVIDEIRDCVRGRDVRHVRLIGEPGLGKTRLALEALSQPDLEPSVIYVQHPEDLQRSALFSCLLRSDDVSRAILVVDDCPEKERASIWGALRERGDRIRLVTLDHGPELSSDPWMRVIQCPMLGKEQVKAIISEYTGPDHAVDRWAEFCGGSPRVAHAVGENLRSNPEDVLREPAAIPIWDRYVLGNSKTRSAEQAQHETVLRCISLFHKFGFEPPVDSEARFIAELAAEVDPSITWPRFQAIVKHYRDRRILQGKTTLFIVPRALHIHLWLQFWGTYGSGTDVAALISRVPEFLLRWFAEMFKYGHASQPCLARIEAITSEGGPFDVRSFVASQAGAMFLNELAQAHPEAVLRCIERIIGSWSDAELGRLGLDRQYIVWALEKIAVWHNLFGRAARMLLRLAVAEDPTHSNGATGTFCGLFGMGRGVFSPSEAPPCERLYVLKAALASSDQACRTLALRAAAQALADHPYTKGVEHLQQGIRQPPRLWSPAKWGEVFGAYKASLRLVVEFRDQAIGKDRAAATQTIVHAAHDMVQWRFIEADIFAALNEIASDPEADLAELVRLVASLRRRRWMGLSRTAAQKMRSLDARLVGTSTESQVRRYVLFGSYADAGHTTKNGQRKYEAHLRKLARSLLSRPAATRRVIPDLLSREGVAIRWFGQALGLEDRSVRWWRPLERMFLGAGENRNPELLAGYLSAVCSRDLPTWEALIAKVMADPAMRCHARQLVLGSGISRAVLDDLCNAVDRGEITTVSLAGVGYTWGRGDIPLERYNEFIAWCVRRGEREAVRIALEAAYVIYCFAKPSPPMPEHPLLHLLTSPQMLMDDGQLSQCYEWAELVKRYVAEYGCHTTRILGAMLDRFSEHNFDLHLGHTEAMTALLELVRADPKRAWREVAARMTNVDSPIARNLAEWLGPPHTWGHEPARARISVFDMADVLVWIDERPAERAVLIARACPKTFNKDMGALTRQMLIRYGHLPHVSSVLWCHFGSGSWSGLASEHHRRVRDMVREWLASETEEPVRRWLELYIEDLGRDIKRNEIDEERMF